MAVQRNRGRFPAEFMFQLTLAERDEVVTVRDHLKSLKFSRFLPFVFTEHGVLMLANVLRSQKAGEMSVKIIQVFVHMREMIAAHHELSTKLKRLAPIAQLALLFCIGDSGWSQVFFRE